MGFRDVNRVVVAVHDINQAKKHYREMLVATFVDADWTGEPFGISIAIAWDAGIELCAPMPGREQDSAVSDFLARRGEGVICVFFGVDDGHPAQELAAAGGYRTVGTSNYSQGEIHAYLDGLFSRYLESTLDTARRSGFTVTPAQIDAKQYD